MNQTSLSLTRHRIIVVAVVVGFIMVVALVIRAPLPGLRVLPSPKPASGSTYELRAPFNDVLNLPAGARVKLNGATIGVVGEISTSDYRAELSLEILQTQKLPVGSTAQIRFSTPLGEQYVAVTTPKDAKAGMLSGGDELAITATSTAPTVEDTFTAMSALLNGGSLDQVNVLIGELATVVDGNEKPLGELIDRVDIVVSNLSENRASFERALTSMDSLAAQLADGTDTINQALVVFPEAIEVLADQRKELKQLLRSLDRASTSALSLIDAAGPAMRVDLKHLRTVMASVTSVRDTLRPTLRSLNAFSKNFEAAVPGDYILADASVTLDFQQDAVLPSEDRYSGPAQVPAPADGSEALTSLLGGGLQ